MQRLSRDREHLHYVFDPAVPPAIEVEPGESFVVETEDAFSGALFEEGVLPVPEQFPELGSTPPRVNPVTGPVYVNGVGPGDLLAVTLERIEPAPAGVHAIVDGWEPGRTARRSLPRAPRRRCGSRRSSSAGARPARTPSRCPRARGRRSPTPARDPSLR